jgi:beta-1,4-mannosyl-glycoprotein beta-1,4-N-acetylglucosaminyltransferase
MGAVGADINGVKPRKIVSCFPFFNELDVLEIHLETMASVVDVFVITEARESHSGLPKPLYLTDNLERFEKFRKKIILQVVDIPPSVTLFEADWYQRECALDVLKGIMLENDVLIYGDVDEIPRPSAIRRAIDALDHDASLEVAHLAQDLFYYYVNLREESGRLLSYTGEYKGVKNKKWLGTTVNRWGRVRDSKLTDLRGPDRKKNGIRIEYGGWHFSWVGGAKEARAEERVSLKLENTAHQEFKTRRNLHKLANRVRSGRDIVHRRGAKFKKLKDLSFLPDFVLSNLDRFDYLILK